MCVTKLTSYDYFIPLHGMCRNACYLQAAWCIYAPYLGPNFSAIDWCTPSGFGAPPGNPGSATVVSLLWNNIVNSFLFSVTQTVYTTVGFLHDISLLSDNVVAICGAEEGALRHLVRSWVQDWRLKLNDLEKGKEISSINLLDDPAGLTVVNLAGEQRLALSYS